MWSPCSPSSRSFPPNFLPFCTSVFWLPFFPPLIMRLLMTKSLLFFHVTPPLCFISFSPLPLPSSFSFFNPAAPLMRIVSFFLRRNLWCRFQSSFRTSPPFSMAFGDVPLAPHLSRAFFFFFYEKQPSPFVGLGFQKRTVLLLLLFPPSQASIYIMTV